MSSSISGAPRRVSRLLLLTLLGSPPVLAATPAVAETVPAPRARLIATLEAALERPDLRALQVGASATASEWQLRASPGAPHLVYQQEGIGSSFDEQPNAIRYLRWTQPVQAPWQRRRARELVRETRAWRGATDRARVLDAVAETAALWVELAGETDRAAVLAARLDRLERAVELQRARYELGEVAGTEVTQLELQRTRDFGDARRADARRAELTARLAARLGPGWRAPEPGDLSALAAEQSGALPLAETLAESAEGAPIVAEAKRRSEVETRIAELERSLRWGRPEISVEWERVPTLDGVEAFDALGLQIAIPLPIGSGHRRRLAAAGARAEVSALEVASIRAETQARLRGALAAAEAARHMIARLATPLESLDDVEASLAGQFRLGGISYLAYIDGLARIDEVRGEAIATHAALLRARLELAVLLDDASLFPLPTTPSEVIS